MDEDKTGTNPFPFAYRHRFFSDNNARAVEHVTTPPMTLLDYFAGQALAAARINVSAHAGYAESYAKSAYDFAEAMLAEKAKREASNGS